MRYLGTGATQDLKEAVKWFRLAADKGNTEAPSFLVLFSMMAVRALLKIIEKRRSGFG